MCHLISHCHPPPSSSLVLQGGLSTIHTQERAYHLGLTVDCTTRLPPPGQGGMRTGSACLTNQTAWQCLHSPTNTTLIPGHHPSTSSLCRNIGGVDREVCMASVIRINGCVEVADLHFQYFCCFDFIHPYRASRSYQGTYGPGGLSRVWPTDWLASGFQFQFKTESGCKKTRGKEFY